MNEAFLPADGEWSGVSVQLRRMRRVVLVGCAAVVGLVGGAAVWLLLVPLAGVAVLVVVVVAAVFGWVFIGRNVRSWRYAERAEDLLIRNGVLFQQLVVVPYGRMQFVDVTAGPLERWFGIATVQLHTAAATSDARIPGTSPGEAARLRDRLSALGEARSAGL